MLLSLAMILLIGLSAAAIFEKLGLPRIIGMLGVGIAVSPYVLDLLDPKILGISSELRQTALIIILIKAGLSLNLSDLILFFFRALKQRSEENRVLRTLCFVLQATQNPSHAFPNAACGGYKQLNELSCLNGNSMKRVGRPAVMMSFVPAVRLSRMFFSLRFCLV